VIGDKVLPKRLRTANVIERSLAATEKFRTDAAK
jgi:hypothetical protein